METVKVKKKEGKIIISIDEKDFSQDNLERILNRVWIQYLVEKANADESLLDIAKDIKANWWKENRDEMLNKMMT